MRKKRDQILQVREQTAMSTKLNTRTCWPGLAEGWVTLTGGNWEGAPVTTTVFCTDIQLLSICTHNYVQTQTHTKTYVHRYLKVHRSCVWISTSWPHNNYPWFPGKPDHKWTKVICTIPAGCQSAGVCHIIVSVCNQYICALIFVWCSSIRTHTN